VCVCVCAPNLVMSAQNYFVAQPNPSEAPNTYLCINLHPSSCFTGHFPGKHGLASFPLEIFGDTCTNFMGRMPFFSPNQPFQNTKRTKIIDPKQEIIHQHHHLFLIHHWTPEGRGFAHSILVFDISIRPTCWTSQKNPGICLFLSNLLKDQVMTDWMKMTYIRNWLTMCWL